MVSTCCCLPVAPGFQRVMSPRKLLLHILPETFPVSWKRHGNMAGSGLKPLCFHVAWRDSQTTCSSLPCRVRPEVSKMDLQHCSHRSSMFSRCGKTIATTKTNGNCEAY